MTVCTCIDSLCSRVGKGEKFERTSAAVKEEEEVRCAARVESVLGQRLAAASAPARDASQ